MTDVLPKLADPKSVLTGSSAAADHREGMSYLETLPRRLVTLYLPLGIIMLVLLFPFYWMALTAIKPDDQLLDMDKVNPFWTTAPTLKHITKLLFERKDELVKVHKDASFLELSNQTANASPLPYHPGAVRYFKEKGLKF